MPTESITLQTNLIPLERKHSGRSYKLGDDALPPEREGEGLRRVAQEFEALFLTKLIRSMRSASEILSSDDEAAGAGMMREMMDEHLARELSAQGGIGLSRLFEDRYGDPAGQIRRIGRGSLEPPVRIAFESYEKVRSGETQGKGGLDRYSAIIDRVAKENDLSPDLLRAVILQESGGNARAISSAGAKGLMQLMDTTATDMGVRRPFDPAENIAGGARYLRLQLDRWEGDLKKALAAYNAGPGTVERYGGIPPYPETQEYVRNVMGYYEGLERLGQPGTTED